MILRNIGKVLRGKATPLQIVMASVLGSMLGFMPGFSQGPALMLLLLVLVAILNANLFIAGIVGLAALAIAIPILPVSVRVGQMLLDGPTQPLFRKAINTPVLALFGFDYYAVTGGMVLGLIFGLAAGLALSWALMTFRRRMAAVEEGSELYQKFASRRWVRALAWVFLGKKGPKSYADLLKRRMGNPIRPLGVVFALLLLALVWVVQAFFSEPIVTALLKRGLERANGATVDVQSAKLDLKAGQLLVTGLAMADPNALETDLLRAKTLEAKISTTDLLTRRLAMDSVTVQDASQGEKRAIRGVRIGPPPEPLPPPSGADKTIGDYIKEAQVWKDRLAQVRQWLEKASGDQGQDPATNPDGTPRTPEQKKEDLKRRLERQLRENGYAHARATYLIDEAPAFLVRQLIVDGVRTPQLADDTLDIHAQNISTNPRLVKDEAKVTVRSRSGRLDTALGLGVPGAGQAGVVAFSFRGLATDSIASHLIPSTPPLVQGGTMDLALSGSWSPLGVGFIDLPLKVTLHDATVSLPKSAGGGGSAKVKELALPLGLRGPIDNPAITIDQKQLADALVAAGAGELADKARGQAEKAINKELDKATGKIGGDAANKAKDALGNLLGGKKKP